MEPKVEAPFGSGISGQKHGELGLGSDEIRRFICGPPETTGKNSSFTALLELPTSQAVELLVGEDFPPIFPSNIFLIDRASKFSVFASADNESNNAHLSNSSSMKLDIVKQELQDSDMDSQHNCFINHITLKSTKRKEREKKVKESSKKSKKVVKNEDSEGGGEKLPYVHVRARRGQATDSHSLAERARREKINAKMKLLQELVPGCNKISGTAMVLDEIINHVQALQREVEFLSMRLAAVNPNIDLNLDTILATESGCSINNSYTEIIPSIWHEGQSDGIRQQQYQQLWHFGELHQQTVWDREEEDTSNFITPEPSLLSYD
ncbi:hypothetical protein RD792_012629 [Penstemon davidsonii]|uniref:BHLH domain-containing protein n=1 Tax=Penstemon davidsonii TaxID=160366 RepID=A0ABR0CYA8_9LAMI|nr:hypothetical protein RD792_012629 [Penstemon davidsonii]